MSESRIWDACKAAMFAEWIMTLPDGIHTMVGERNSNLSGGQPQRIAIARAIAKDCDVILLDEPTSALDADTSNAVIMALEHLTKGKTLIHISHQISMLTACSRILRLEGGTLWETR